MSHFPVSADAGTDTGFTQRGSPTMEAPARSGKSVSVVTAG